jgi:hypothetical protein
VTRSEGAILRTTKWAQVKALYPVSEEAGVLAEKNMRAEIHTFVLAELGSEGLQPQQVDTPEAKRSPYPLESDRYMKLT